MNRTFSAESRLIHAGTARVQGQPGTPPPMVVDTTATSLLQRPLDRGAAASLHSLTKAMSGHST